MTLDGFLTVLALLAAIYAVLSPLQRLRLGLAWKAQTLLGLVAIALILAFEIYDVPLPECPRALDGACRLLVVPGDLPGANRKVAFLIALAWLAAASLVHRRARPSLGNVCAMAQLATSQIDEEEYSDALKLLQPAMGVLARAARRQCWRQRLHDAIMRFGPPDQASLFASFGPPGARKQFGAKWPLWAARPVRLIAHVLPSFERQEVAARDMLQNVLNSKALLDYIVQRRPYFAIAAMRYPGFGVVDFCERYLTGLIAYRGSALYHELALNQESRANAYVLPTRNRLLHFLFADAREAERLSAWRGVGNYLERLLDGKEDTQYVHSLQSPGALADDDHFRDPMLAGLFYFDIMVRSAAIQGVPGHMWLYYTYHLARRLERDYDSSGEDVDRQDEFPVRAARIIYELTQCVSAWVELFTELPVDSLHRRFPDRRDSPGTVPHAATKALAEVLAIVVLSDRIDHGVVQTLHTVVMRTISHFGGVDAEVSRMRAWIIDTLLDSCSEGARGTYWRRLKRLLDETDTFLVYEVADYETALRSRLARVGRG